MKYTIEIEMDNAAFDKSPGDEVARILIRLANRVSGEVCKVGDVTPLMDHNGNRVGTARVLKA
jgi:hypothetical protein